MSFSLLPRGRGSCDGPNKAFDVICEQLQLTWRQREAGHVIYCSPSVDQDDHAVLAVEHRLDLVVHNGGLVFELLP